ncbi:nucleoporin protein Ndc1-Nup [Phlebopus sp. FC_14]|nr:nucleoporin protein Ndc1-Nup [Phlebopus sp. FC_14]
MFSTQNAASSSKLTPIKSTLTPRTSPTVPPASQTFEPLVKSVLRHRLVYNIFAYSAAFSLASNVLFSGDDIGVFSRLFSLSTWLVALLTWLVGVLPVLVLRKVYLTPNPAPASSPSTVVASAFAKASIRHSVTTYIVSAILLLTLDLLNASSDESRHVGIFAHSRKHPYYLNGRFIFLVLAQAWFAVTFAFRNVMLDRFVLRWSTVPTTSNMPYTPHNFAKLMVTIALFALVTFTVFNAALGLTRIFVLPVLLRLPILRSILKPFIGHFVRGAWTLTLPLRHFALEIRAFTLGLTTLASWEFAESLFDICIPQPAPVANTTAEPITTLISGITSPDFMFLHFAYAELRDAALDESASGAARRVALFSDQKFNPNLWNTLARESLIRLGEDYQTFLRRGKPVPPSPPPAAAAPAPLKPAAPPSTPLLRQAIYKTPRQSPLGSMLDVLASNSEVPKTGDTAADGGATHPQVHEVPLPELFRSTVVAPVAAPLSGSAVAAGASPTASSTLSTRVKQECRALLIKYTPLRIKEASARWVEWWTRERVNKAAEMCLPNRELDGLVVEVLSALVCVSLTEDRYGVVQRDIPRILEAFLSFLSALEEYQLEIRGLYNPPTPEEIAQGDAKVLEEKERMRIEVARTSEVISIVADRE